MRISWIDGGRLENASHSQTMFWLGFSKEMWAMNVFKPGDRAGYVVNAVIKSSHAAERLARIRPDVG